MRTRKQREDGLVVVTMRKRSDDGLVFGECDLNDQDLIGVLGGVSDKLGTAFSPVMSPEEEEWDQKLSIERGNQKYLSHHIVIDKLIS